MSTQAERLVRIEDKSGRRYAVTEQQYKHGKLADGRTYEEAGYTIVSYEDGTEYGEGKEPTSFGLVTTAKAPEIGAEGSTVMSEPEPVAPLEPRGTAVMPEESIPVATEVHENE